MTRTKVDKLPGVKFYTKGNHEIYEVLDGFINDGNKIELLTDHHYRSLKSAQNSINRICKRDKLPVLSTVRLGKLYLIRTDM